MKYPPIYIVYWAVIKYLSDEQIDILKVDMVKGKRLLTRNFISAIKKHIDLERLLKNPIILEDAWIYNYIQYEAKTRFPKSKLIAKYEREIVIPSEKKFQEVLKFFAESQKEINKLETNAIIIQPEGDEVNKFVQGNIIEPNSSEEYAKHIELSKNKVAKFKYQFNWLIRDFMDLLESIVPNIKVSKTEIVSKIILSLLLLMCLMKMPYGFYILVRFIATISFSAFAYQYYKTKRHDQKIIYVALTIIFQPFFKIGLNRTLWNIIDVIIAIYLIVSVFKHLKIYKTEKEKSNCQLENEKSNQKRAIH